MRSAQLRSAIDRRSSPKSLCPYLAHRWPSIKNDGDERILQRIDVRLALLNAVSAIG
jgi:hypothetical protein